MRRLAKSFTLNPQTIKNLERYAALELITQSRAVENIINNFLATPEIDKEPVLSAEDQEKADKTAAEEFLKNGVPGEYTGDKVVISNVAPPGFLEG